MSADRFTVLQSHLMHGHRILDVLDKADGWGSGLPTDMARLMGLKCTTEQRHAYEDIGEYQVEGCLILTASPCNGKVMCLDTLQDQLVPVPANSLCAGIRPAILLDQNTDIQPDKKIDIPTDYDEQHHAFSIWEIGQYPHTVVDKDLNPLLERLYQIGQQCGVDAPGFRSTGEFYDLPSTASDVLAEDTTCIKTKTAQNASAMLRHKHSTPRCPTAKW